MSEKQAQDQAAAEVAEQIIRIRAGDSGWVGALEVLRLALDAAEARGLERARLAICNYCEQGCMDDPATSVKLGNIGHIYLPKWGTYYPRCKAAAIRALAATEEGRAAVKEGA